MPKQEQPEPEEFQYAIVGVVGDDPGNPQLLVTVSPVVSDPSSITSCVYDVKITPSQMARTPLHELDSWATRMTRSPKGTLLVVDMDGVLHAGRAGKWSKRDLRCPGGLIGVWCAGENDVFACGGKGELVRVVGDDVDLQVESEKRTLYAVHGSSTRHVVAVGDDGGVFRYDGRKWHEPDPPTDVNLLSVVCISETEAFIGGTDGKLFRTDSLDFEPLRSPDVSFYDLAWHQGKVYAAAGEDGILILGKDGMEPEASLKEPIYNLDVVGDRLFASGENLLATHNGVKWIQGYLNFGK